MKINPDSSPPSLLRNRLRNRELLYPVLTALSVLVCWRSVILNHYAFWDDFRIFTLYRLGELKPFSGWISEEGRPLYDLLVYLASFGMETHEDLIYLRAIQLVGLGLTAMLFYRVLAHWLQPSGWGSSIAVGAAASVCTLTPSLGVFAGWATPFPFSLFIAFNLYLGQRFFEKSGSARDRRSELLRNFGVVCLLIASECVYQPNVGFFLLPATFAILATASPTKARLKAFLHTVAIFSFAMGLYLVLYKIAQATIFAEGSKEWRTVLNFNPARVWHYFFQVLLPQTVQSWSSLFGSRFRIGAMGLTAAIFLFQFGVHLFRKRWSSSLIQFLALFISFFLTIAPLLFVANEYTPIRSISASYSLLAGAVMIVLLRWILRPRNRFFQSISSALLALVTVTNFWVAQYSVSQLMVARSVTETERFFAYFEEHPFSGKPIYIFETEFTDVFLTPWTGFHSYGMISSFINEQVKHLVNMVYYETAGSPKRGSAEAARFQYPSIVLKKEALHLEEIAGYEIVDALEVLTGVKKYPYPLTSNRATLETPLGFFRETTNPDWKYNPKWGYIRFVSEHQFIKYGFGEFNLVPPDGQDLYLQHKQLGTFFTREKYLPYIFFMSLGEKWGNLTINAEGKPAVVIDNQVIGFDEIEDSDER